MRIVKLITLTALCLMWSAAPVAAQELNAKIVLNHKQVEGTNTSTIDNLQTTLTDFVNNRHWTNQQYAPNERINCTFNITVKKFDETSGQFNCSLLVQSTRPVYGSNYTTVVFSNKDDNFNFTYREFDQLEFRVDQIDNELTALMAYYAYLIIGLDNETFAPEGGEDCLQTVQTIANNAQSLPNAKGWKAFDSDRNRYAIISDYLDGSMKPVREMMYKYYREGLDEMATNTELARANVSDALMLLKQAHDNKRLSKLPQLITEFKRDEIVNIFTDKGLAKDKQTLVDALSAINASYSSYWRKMAK